MFSAAATVDRVTAAAMPSPQVRGDTVLGRNRLRVSKTYDVVVCSVFLRSVSPQLVTYSVAQSVLLLEQPCLNNLGTSRKDQHSHRAFGARKVFDFSAQGPGQAMWP